MTRTTHRLKTWPEYFWAAYGQAKTFELRKNDRDYKVGDVLELMEWNPGRQEFTGQSLYVRVTYLMTPGSDVPGIEPGYCVMGIALDD